MALIKFENEDKLFVKFFLLDSSVNLNQWGVTRKAMLKGLKTFIGKPFVLTPDFGHPNAESGDDLLVQQEKYRVGDIIDVGIEQRTGKAYGVAEITNAQAKDIIKNGEVNFVSPSIVFNNNAEVGDGSGNAIITEFEGAHVAGVREPAYGIDKAEIKGKCIGSKESCDITLQKVEAKVSDCGDYLTVKNGKYGNIDQESLQNITKIDLIKKKKKKDADDIDITMPRKRKDPVKTNTNKGKKTQKELDEDYELQMQSFEKKETKKDSVTKEKYKEITDKVTSNKPKKSKKTNNMTKKSNEEEKDKKEESEEEEKEEGQSLEEQLKDKEETDILKSEDEKDDEEAEEEDEEKDAEDEDKLDLTDKQKEFLKDSKLAKQVKALRAEVKALKTQARNAEIEPIINSILDARQSVEKIDARSEYNKLSKMSINTLKELKAHYDTISQVKTHPRYVVKNASINSSDKSGDDLFLQMRGNF